MSEKIYEDAFIIVRKRDDTEYDEIEVEVDGEQFKLLGFTVVRDGDGRPLLAFKIRGDRNLVLYYDWEGGDQELLELEEVVIREFPDHEIRDMRMYLRHHLEIERKTMRYRNILKT